VLASDCFVRACAGRQETTNDIEAVRVRRIVGWPGEGGVMGAGGRIGVRRRCPEQQGEPVQVLAQLGVAVGGVADELFQGCGQAGGVAGQPLAEELQDFGKH
jgi:hypothetical protein